MAAPSRLRLLAQGAAALGLLLGLFSELFERPFATGFGDYQFFHHSWELGQVALSRYGELPLWNPYQCGGIPEWGDPQSQLFHPIYFLTFVFGSTLALKLFILLHAAAGLAGMYRFARSEEGLGPAAAALAALVFTGSGFFAWHVGSGHGGFVAFYLTPWLLLGFRRALRDPRWTALCALVFALALFAGGVYAFPYFGLLLGLDALLALARRVEPRKLATALGVSALLALLLSAFRLVPIIEHLLWYPRHRPQLDAISLRELWGFLTHFDRAADLVQEPGHPYARVEYGAYVGAGVVLLALVGALTAERTRLRLLVPLLLFTSLALGDFASFAPWPLLRRLPVFGSLQVPSRFLFAVTFFLALLAGAGLDWLEARAAERGWLQRLREHAALAPWLLAAALGAPVVLQHRAVLDGHWEFAPLLAGSGGHYHLRDVAPPKTPSPYPPRAQAPTDEIGSGWCYTGMGYEPAPGLWPGDVDQARVAPLGSVVTEGRSTRAAFAEVVLPIGGRVVFNQTYAPGWRASLGDVAVDAGRLAVELPPGTHRVVVRYAPASLPWGTLGSLCGLAGVAVLLRVRDGRRRALALAAGAACAVACYARAARPGPRLPPERPKLALAAGASDYAERGQNDWYRPENAVDGRLETEWLAPPGTKGWLDVRPEKPLSVRHVVLVNATNPPHGDFGSRQVRVESFREGQLVESRELTFTQQNAGVSLSGVVVDRVRVSVETWQGVGGGLAEVQLW